MQRISLVMLPAFLLFVASPAISQDAPTPAASKNVERINEALAKLPPEKAQMFDEIMRRNTEVNRSKQLQLRSIYTDLRKNFSGDPFNKEAFLAKSTEARDLQSSIRASLDTDLAEIASKLTQEERMIIFGALPTRYTRDMEEKQ